MLQSALRQRNNLLQDLRVRARALSVDRSNRKGQVICTSTADVHSFLSCPLILWLGSIQSSAGSECRGWTSYSGRGAGEQFVFPYYS